MNPDLLSLISLQGKTALITGGSRGIGRAISVLLAKAGAFVLINYVHNRDAAGETLDLVQSVNGKGKLVHFDVCDSQAVQESLSSILKLDGRIDFLINNAGINRDGLIGRLKDSDWDDVIQTNLTGIFYVCRAVAKQMIRNRCGRIINISSTAGDMGNAGQVNYSAAKAGIQGFTKALAELAPRNILVNSISPGIIHGGLSENLTKQQIDTITSHIPIRRMGEAEEVACAVLFLCSELSNYMTGQVIRVNGGLYM